MERCFIGFLDEHLGQMSVEVKYLFFTHFGGILCLTPQKMFFFQYAHFFSKVIFLPIFIKTALKSPMSLLQLVQTDCTHFHRGANVKTCRVKEK